MPFVLEMHPEAHLQKDLKHSHHQQQDHGKCGIDAPGGYSRKGDQCQNDREDKHHNMPLRPFLPMAVLHRAVRSGMLFCRHGYPTFPSRYTTVKIKTQTTSIKCQYMAET
ncbi:hypothetical protein D3C75_877840 [compost metagenome]